ncbi:MAG: MFS transporter [Caldilineales bacterium]|nr:MFS transporter [Caldilineales bacterium]
MTPRTLTYFIAFIALGLASASMGPTLPTLAAHTGVTLAEISILFVARSLGYLSASLTAGRLFDHLSGHLLMALALLFMAGMLALIPLLPLLWLLTLVIFLLGLAESMLDLGGNTLLVWEHGEGVGPAMNALHFCFGVGAFLAPIIVAWSLQRSNDIIWAYGLLALLMLPVLARLLTLPSPKPRSAASQTPSQPLRRKFILWIVLFFFLIVGIEASVGGWLYTFGVRTTPLGPTAAAYLTSAFWGALTGGRLLAIPLATRLRARVILLIDLLGILLCLILLLAWPGRVWAVWAAAIVAGLAIASLFPTTITFASRRMLLSGRVTGWFFAGASLGGMSLPWVIGQFFERSGPMILPQLLLLALLAAFAIFALLVRQGRGGW